MCYRCGATGSTAEYVGVHPPLCDACWSWWRRETDRTGVNPYQGMSAWRCQCQDCAYRTGDAQAADAHARSLFGHRVQCSSVYEAEEEPREDAVT